jgi:transcriptional regulator with PAS, ATPase and Fis domain
MRTATSSSTATEARMTPRDKVTPSPSFPPLGQAVIESFRDGVVVFDVHGRMVYANEHARQIAGINGDAQSQEGDALRSRLLTLGGRAHALRAGGAALGEVVFLAGPDQARTLADRERQAIVDTLRGTSGRLAETARRLGISRTTLWRRLKAYGLHPNGRGGSSVRA